jgi:hypothetical protein
MNARNNPAALGAGDSLHAIGERLLTLVSLQSVAVALVDRLVEKSDSPLAGLLHNLGSTLHHIEEELAAQADSLLQGFDDMQPSALVSSPPQVHGP